MNIQKNGLKPSVDFKSANKKPPSKENASLNYSLYQAPQLYPTTITDPVKKVILTDKLSSDIINKQNRFRRRFYQDTTRQQWDDWKWQLSHRIKTSSDLTRIISLTEDEQAFINSRGGNLPLAITPYYASLINLDNPYDPIRKSIVPVIQEVLQSTGESEDPLDENSHSPIPGIVHRYPDRVLFLITDYCSVYCRYCTRSRLVGGNGEISFSRAQWEAALQYIESTPSIRDVLISGGDPLTLTDERLEYLLMRLKNISHVEFIRIGTKVPVVLPQRITSALVKMLRKYHPLWMSINVMHPAELTSEAQKAFTRLADAGIPLGSQTVLLAGINDTVQTMKTLMHGLLKIRVRPYYIYQCDPIKGSAHFRTSIDKGLEIMQGLQGFTTGYAVPSYVVDAPGGGGKIRLFPNPVVRRDSQGWLLRNYEGKEFFYNDPQVETVDRAPKR